MTKCATASATARLRTASTRQDTAGDSTFAASAEGSDRGLDQGGKAEDRTLIAIGVAGDGTSYVTPCGVCRQFLREFSTDLPIYLFKDDTVDHTVVGLDRLLPMSFGPDSLNIS